jgi:molybdenum cofactor cytidylyltransferase
MSGRHPAPFLSGVVLAAGRSQRMGTPKQLLLMDGRPMLQHVVEAALGARLNEVIVVLGHRAEEVRDAIRLPSAAPVRMVTSPDPAGDQSSSLRLGLRAVDPAAQAAVVLLGDQPGVPASLIDDIAKAFLSSPLPAARPMYTTRTGTLPGHPVFLDRTLWPEMAGLAGDQGARDLLIRHPEWLLQVPISGDPPPDIDTWDTYQSQTERRS